MPTPPYTPSPRPYLMVRAWTWFEARPHVELPGVGLFRGTELKAHLTPAEARTLADTLHDLADQIDATNQEK